MNNKLPKSILVVVAHPDDETLWAGGTILQHPSDNWFVLCLCRGDDPERSPRFYNTLKLFKADGIMGNLDDGPDQHPLEEDIVEKEILRLLPKTHFDLIITHNSTGEYTKHLRHEEVNKAVMGLWFKQQITVKEIWTFAYEDGKKRYLPHAVERAHIVQELPEKIWTKKYNIITNTYGFKKDSWEAQTTPTTEAFWKFTNPQHAILLANSHSRKEENARHIASEEMSN